ncbi:MAG: hypothetical protein QOK37_4248 [Thermoanaerobaculia bacterium]|jgi:hypothetical protein|nr:hypothetical protein [Thermoanaerobaculia bacterium]
MGLDEGVVLAVTALMAAAAIIWPAARISRRTGHSPWLALAALIPLANIALLWFLALSPWQADQTENRVALPSLRSFLAVFRSMRERIQLIGLPPKP